MWTVGQEPLPLASPPEWIFGNNASKETNSTVINVIL